jgi:simple sugar transport system permease protein
VGARAHAEARVIAFVMLRIALPYLLAALGGCLAERSGVIDLALEAKLLVGAFVAAVVARATDSMWVGIAAGAAGGAAIGAIHAALALRGRADQVVVGIALNIAAYGGTRYGLGLLYGSAANSKPCPPLPGAAWADPILWLAIGAAVLVPLAVARAPFGLRLRAAGDRPDALRAAGLSVTRTRAIAVTVGGALAGLGGAELALKNGFFEAEMSAGRGYIALAAVILAGWRPARAALVATAFGVAEWVRFQLQMHVAAIPPELVALFPYVVALAVLAIAPTRTRPPAALGQIDDP